MIAEADDLRTVVAVPVAVTTAPAIPLLLLRAILPRLRTLGILAGLLR